MSKSYQNISTRYRNIQVNKSHMLGQKSIGYNKKQEESLQKTNIAQKTCFAGGAFSGSGMNLTGSELTI